MSRIKSVGTTLIAAFMLPLAQADSLCYSDDPPPARYQVKGGEVIDTQTGLVWQRCSVGQRWSDAIGCVGVIRQMNWDDASKLSQGGWRLPSRRELATLLDHSCGSPAIDERAFPDMELTKLWYWTDTRDGALVWYVAFGGGSERQASPRTWNAVRLVRSGR